MLIRMIFHGLMAAMIVAGGAYAYASTVVPVSVHQEHHE